MLTMDIPKGWAKIAEAAEKYRKALEAIREIGTVDGQMNRGAEIADKALRGVDG